MPVLGVGGVLDLRRELPPAVVLSPEAAVSHVNALDVATDGYWTGDRVRLWGPLGLPFDRNGNGIPDVTGGWGMFFGSRWGLYGPRRERLTSGAGKWFGPEAPFLPPDPGPIVPDGEFWIHRDQLDRLTFYESLEDAMDGDPAQRILFFPVDFGLLLLAPVGSTGYAGRLAPAEAAIAALRLPEGTSEQRLEQLTDAALPEPVGADDTRPWRFLAEMEEWTLELDANEASTTAVGERFSESTRTLISGSGTLNFHISRTESGDELDSTFLARLLLLLEKGGKAEANFNLTKRAGSYTVTQGFRRLPTADTRYNASLLLVATAVNTRADDVIRGTARFATVGPVKMLIG